MAKTLLIPLGGSGGGGDMSNYYTKQQIDAMLQGVQSIQGFQGIAGENGSQGIQGIKGSDGTNGVDGLQGIQGIAGQNGTNGVDGSQGIQGIKGSDGTNGVDGLQGIQGTMGIQGPAGSGGGTSRYDISTKSQEELADFYQNWETVMASNDVYVGIYPVTSVIPEYTVEEYTAVLLEFNISFGLEDDETTETPIVNGVVGAYYILPNGMGGLYGTDVPLASKDYVDAVVAGIQAIQGIQGTAGTNGADGLQGIQGTAGTNGVDGLQGIQGTMGIQGPAGGGGAKIEILSMTSEELLEFYNDVMDGNILDFSNYTGSGYEIINAYQFNSGLVIGEEPDTYTTDGTEVALMLNERIIRSGSQYYDTGTKEIFYYVALISPTIFQQFGEPLIIDVLFDSNVQPDWNQLDSDAPDYIKNKPTIPSLQTVSLQFTLGDSSVVNYDFFISPQQ